MNKIASTLIALFLFFLCSGPVKKNSGEAKNSLSDPIVAEAKSFISELPERLNEISGMLVWKELYWGFNDSGGDAVLFGFNKNGEIQCEVELDIAENRDWESITQDDDYLYVGDFGNNSGNRHDLCIYKISKNAISSASKQKVNAQKIEFEYAAQKQFNFAMNTTPFDCEAMAEFNGMLYLFSKNWRDQTTEVYSLSKIPGKYTLEAIDTLKVNLLVTGADFSNDKKSLALIGYLDYKTYLWIFTGFEDDKFDSGTSKYLHLENIDGSQTEGVSFLNQDSLLISCEETRTYRQQVFLFELNSLNYGTHKSE